ncbi:MAG: S1 domain-containing protein [Henriciella sp.]
MTRTPKIIAAALMLSVIASGNFANAQANDNNSENRKDLSQEKNVNKKASAELVDFRQVPAIFIMVDPSRAKLKMRPRDQDLDLNVTLVGFTGNVRPTVGERATVLIPEELGIRVLVGDEFKIEMSPYELDNGERAYRLHKVKK